MPRTSLTRSEMIQAVKQWIKDNPSEYNKIQQGPNPTKTLQQAVEQVHGQFFWDEKGGFEGSAKEHIRFRLEPKGRNRQGQRLWGAKSVTSRAIHKATSEAIRNARLQIPVNDLLEFAYENNYTADQVFDFIDDQKTRLAATEAEVKKANSISARGVDGGHIGSLQIGFPNSAENLELEDRPVNQEKRGKSPNRRSLLAQGVMPNWQAQFVQFANPDLPLPHPSQYTHQQQQQIRNSKNPNAVVQEIEAQRSLTTSGGSVKLNVKLPKAKTKPKPKPKPRGGRVGGGTYDRTTIDNLGTQGGAVHYFDVPTPSQQDPTKYDVITLPVPTV